MKKMLAAPLLLFISQTSQATIINIDFLVDVTTRQAYSNGSWNADTSFTGQQFTLTVTLDSDNYMPGTVEFWSGQGVTYVQPSAYPIEFSATPFDDEINAVTPVLDYHGNTEYPASASLSGEFNYNQTFDSATVDQSFYRGSSLNYMNREGSNFYFASLSRNLGIGMHWADAPFTESDIAPLTLMEYLNMGMGQSYDFYQSVREGYTPNHGYEPWTYMDGGIQYFGSATMTSISAVPLPAAFWLFGSGLMGLISFGFRRSSRR